ncbi:MAG: hypothetical protein ACLVC5_00320 [Clostridia bacterium]
MSEFNFFSLKCDVGVRLVCWRQSLGLLPLARGTAASRPTRAPGAIILFLSDRRKGSHQKIPGTANLRQPKTSGGVFEKVAADGPMSHRRLCKDFGWGSGAVLFAKSSFREIS